MNAFFQGKKETGIWELLNGVTGEREVTRTLSRLQTTAGALVILVPFLPLLTAACYSPLWTHPPCLAIKWSSNEGLKESPRSSHGSALASRVTEALLGSLGRRTRIDPKSHGQVTACKRLITCKTRVFAVLFFIWVPKNNRPPPQPRPKA